MPARMPAMHRLGSRCGMDAEELQTFVEVADAGGVSLAARGVGSRSSAAACCSSRRSSVCSYWRGTRGLDPHGGGSELSHVRCSSLFSPGHRPRDPSPERRALRPAAHRGATCVWSEPHRAGPRRDGAPPPDASDPHQLQQQLRRSHRGGFSCGIRIGGRMRT